MNIYREHILELYRNPAHKGEIDNPSCQAVEFNPACGDKLKVSMIITDRIITDAKFSGTACAISTAGASLLLDHLIGKSVEEVQAMTYKDIEDLLQIPLGPVRVKCATIALHAAKKALQEQ